MRILVCVCCLMGMVSFAQRTCVAGNCQDGVGKVIFYNDPTCYYEGEFKNGKYHGNGRFFDKSGTISSGFWWENNHNGLGTLWIKGLVVLSYFKLSIMTEEQGLPYELLKKHQDIAFSRFKKADLLTKTIVTLPWIERNFVDYEQIDEYGDKVGEKTEIESSLTEKQFTGYVNNTSKNIYVRCYRKKYYRDSGTYQYIDDSFVLAPGEKVMSNFRLPPDNFIGYETYLEENKTAFVYLGQYYLEPGKQPLTIFEWEKAMGYGAIPTVADSNSQPKPAESTPVQPAKANISQSQPTSSSLTPEQMQVLLATEKRLDEEDELKQHPIILFFDPSRDATFPAGQLQDYFRIMKNIAKTLQEHPDLKITIDGYSSHSKPKTRQKLAYARAYKIWNYLVTVCKVNSLQILENKGSASLHRRGDVVEISYH